MVLCVGVCVPLRVCEDVGGGGRTEGDTGRARETERGRERDRGQVERVSTVSLLFLV